MEKLKEIYAKMQSVADNEKGQTMVEYALLLALIALIVAAALPTLTNAISGEFTTIAGKL
jgi:Flp pilus assembly pilin Flp